MPAKDPFQQAYIRGLANFVMALENCDPKDEAVFKPALVQALTHFGMTGAQLAKRVAHGSGTISKWVNTDCMPARADREVTLAWILEQSKQQLKSLVNV